MSAEIDGIHSVEHLMERLSKRSRNLTDEIDVLLPGTSEHDIFWRYLEATTDAESYTGKRRVDNIFAAHRLMEINKHSPIISGEKLVVVQHAMNVVLRRYGIAPSQRRS